MENREFIPRYAAGSREDNIRTGRKINLGSPRKRKNSAPPVLIAILALLLLVYFFGPVSGKASATITSTNRSADNGTIYMTATVVNGTNRFIFNTSGSASVKTVSGTIVGIKSVEVAPILKPGDTKYITIEIPIAPSEENLECSLNLTVHRLPVKG